MNGFETIIKLPDNIISNIKTEFGSIDEFYKKVFLLAKEEYDLRNDIKNVRISIIKNELLDIEEKLEEFGINDGGDIINEITSDFSEIVVRHNISQLNNFLKIYGTNYDQIVNWIKGHSLL